MSDSSLATREPGAEQSHQLQASLFGFRAGTIVAFLDLLTLYITEKTERALLPERRHERKDSACYSRLPFHVAGVPGVEPVFWKGPLSMVPILPILLSLK